jgi:hypothetical protein
MKIRRTLFNVLGVCVILFIGACQSNRVTDENPDIANPNPVMSLATSMPADLVPQTPPSDSYNGNESAALPSFSAIDINVTVVPVEITPPSSNQSAGGSQSFGPIIDSIILNVKNDLAQKISISLDKITVLEVDAVEWPDGSLGCGKPGTEYVQVVTPGFRISLEANGSIFFYHTNASKQIILCNERLPHGIIPTP